MQIISFFEYDLSTGETRRMAIDGSLIYMIDEFSHKEALNDHDVIDVTLIHVYLRNGCHFHSNNNYEEAIRAWSECPPYDPATITMPS